VKAEHSERMKKKHLLTTLR